MCGWIKKKKRKRRRKGGGRRGMTFPILLPFPSFLTRRNRERKKEKERGEKKDVVHLFSYQLDALVFYCDW